MTDFPAKSDILQPRATLVGARFALVFGVLVAGLGAGLWWLRQLEKQETARLLAEAQTQRAQMLELTLGRISRSVQRYADDLAGSTALTRFAVAPDPAWAKEKLAPTLATSNAQALWVLGPEGAPIFSASRSGTTPPPSAPLESAALRAVLNGARPPHVFTLEGGTLIELCSTPIRSGPRAEDATLAWLVVALRWDDSHLATLASVTDSEVRLAEPAAAFFTNDAATGTIVLQRGLTDWQGRPLRTLVARHRVPEFATLLETGRRQELTFFAFGALVVVAFGLGLHAWVLRPLRAIRTSLARDETAPLAELQEDRSELGQIARLIETSFQQKAALRREIAERERVEQMLREREAELRRTLEERARLGRDLHDGVIQTLYATGMGLRGIRALLTPQQTEAAARLEQTRAALNETIHDVRNFIVGLEPEALKLQTFAQAVMVLLEVAQSSRPIRTTVEIDEDLARRLTLAQRFHALQITRESVSNALRHGEATHVRVRLHPEGEFVHFEVSDDGCGFDPTNHPGSGHGFASLKQRARELGAELTIDSAPGQGTTVRIVFSLLTKS